MIRPMNSPAKNESIHLALSERYPKNSQNAKSYFPGSWRGKGRRRKRKRWRRWFHLPMLGGQEEEPMKDEVTVSV